MFYGVASNTLSGSTFGVSNGMANPALSFATVTDIRDTNIRVQPQVLLNNMNGWGLVDKNKALYPFVSDGYIESRATQHKYNLMNPADTDAAFRLTFAGGWTHSATGAKPNGTTGYADTHIIPTTNLSLNNTHASYYSRTIDSGTKTFLGASTNAFLNRIVVLPKFGDGNYYSDHYQYTTSRIAYANTRTDAFFLDNRETSTSHTAYRNLVLKSTNVGVAGSMPNVGIYLGATNEVGVASNFGAYECALSSIGDGLTPTNASDFYTLVQNLQIALARNI